MCVLEFEHLLSLSSFSSYFRMLLIVLCVAMEVFLLAVMNFKLSVIGLLMSLPNICTCFFTVAFLRFE